MSTTERCNPSAVSDPTSDIESTRGQRAHVTEKYPRALMWTAFVALTLVLALVLQALATHVSETPQYVEPPDMCLTPNPRTAALRDGDDVRARFLASLCNPPTEAASAR
jgi:hypothetical protein